LRSTRSTSPTSSRRRTRPRSRTVVSARGFWKLPEAWQRGRERENALAISLAVLRIATFAGLTLTGQLNTPKTLAIVVTVDPVPPKTRRERGVLVEPGPA
jgi:hypothetical protein